MAEGRTPKETGVVLAWFVFAIVALGLARYSTDHNPPVVKPVAGQSNPETK